MTSVFPLTKITSDFVVEYDSVKLSDGDDLNNDADDEYLDLAAMADLIDDDPRFEDALGEKIVFVNPSLVFPHNPPEGLDEASQEAFETIDALPEGIF